MTDCEYLQLGETAVSPSECASLEPWLEGAASRYVLKWLVENQLRFAICQTGKRFFVSQEPMRRLSVFEFPFVRRMGLRASPNRRALWMCSRYQVWPLDKPLAASGDLGNSHEAIGPIHRTDSSSHLFLVSRRAR